MSFLLLTDYNKQITSDNLNQVTDSTPQYRIDAEAAAIAEVRSYLVQRYNVDRAFADVLLFDITATYNVGDRVQFTAPVWNNSTAYSIGQYVTYSITNTTSVYKALTSNTGVAPGCDPTQWQLVCLDKTIFTNIYPQLLWDPDVAYTLNQQFVFLGNVYKVASPAPQGTVPVDAQGNLNTAYILVSSASSTTGIYPCDTTHWQEGDNRNQVLVTYLIDMVLYHLHSRINPRNIPVLRENRYHDAKKFFEDVAAGKINCEIPVKIEFAQTTGRSIFFGFSNDTNTRNTY